MDSRFTFPYKAMRSERGLVLGSVFYYSSLIYNAPKEERHAMDFRHKVFLVKALYIELHYIWLYSHALVDRSIGTSSYLPIGLIYDVDLIQNDP